MDHRRGGHPDTPTGGPAGRGPVGSPLGTHPRAGYRRAPRLRTASPAIHQGDPGADPGRVVLRAEENCRPGRIRRDPEHGLLVAELLLDRRLRTGDTHLLGYGFDDAPTPTPSCEYVRGFNAVAGQYVLQVTFDPAALPVRCHRFAVRAPGERPHESEELTLDGHHSVHLVATGLLGIGWDWD